MPRKKGDELDEHTRPNEPADDCNVRIVPREEGDKNDD